MVRLPCIAVSVLVATLPTQVRADELQRRLVAGAQATNTADHAFRQTITASGTGVESSSKTYVTTYDPRRVPDERWRLVSIDGRSAKPEELQKWRKAKRASVPSYADLAKWLGAPATRTDGPGGTVIYRYPRLPAGTLKLGSHDASANTAAEVQVNPGAGAPYVERVRFTSTKGFRMMLVASVRSMVFISRYRRLPGGEIIPTDVTSNIVGAMMGKSGELRTTVGYAAWQKVR